MATQTLFRLIALLMIILLSASCATSVTDQRSLLKQHAELLSGSTISANGKPLASLVPENLLAVSDEMRTFLAQQLTGHSDDKRKTELIVKALLDDGLQVQYSNLKTYTAKQTFQTREGNCLSFTNLFIALAREAGLDAHFQEVRIPPIWTAENETFYYNLHINVLVQLRKNSRVSSHARNQVVDFDTQVFDSGRRMKRISDATAAAQYYNNMGAYYLTQKDPISAFQHARKAIRLRPNTGYFWTNMGTILRHAGDLQHAEKAYLVAIDLSQEPSAMSNLARLYNTIGKPQLAAKYSARVEAFRRKNPYLLYARAEQAYANANYASTQELLRAAIKQHSKEHQFYRLQGLAWLKLREPNKARKSFSQAAKVAMQAEHTALYERKLEMLAHVN